MTSQDSLERLDDDAATLPFAELHVEVGDRAIRCAMQDLDLAPALGAPPVCDRCGCSSRWHQRLSPGPTALTIAVFPRLARLLSRSATAAAIWLALDAVTGVVSPGE